MANRIVYGLMILPLALGCQRERTDLMPLSETSHWNYLVRSVNSYSNHVHVSRRIAVGDTEGYELQSNLGTSHLGWSHGRLITDQMAGAKFTPALSLLTPSTQKVEWAGWVDWGDKHEPAKAETVQDTNKLEVNGVTISTTRSIVTMKLPKRIIQLTNWFKPGVGMVRQEQRTDDRVDVILEYLDQS